METEIQLYRSFIAPIMAIGALNIVVNTYLVLALRKFKLLESKSYRFIIAVSLSDIWVGISLVLCLPVFQFVSTNLQYKIGHVFKRVVSCPFVYFSGFMILALALDRYLHMSYLLTYDRIMTNRRASALMAFFMAASVCLSVIDLLGVIFDYRFGVYLTFNILFSLYAVTVSGLYLRAYLSITKRIKDRDISTLPRQRRPNKEFSKVALLILGCLLICYAPHLVASLLRYTHGSENLRTALIAKFCADLLLYANSSFNAIIFIMFNKKLRKYTIGLFQRLVEE